MAMLGMLGAIATKVCRLSAPALAADDFAAPAEPRYVPTVAFALGRFDERLRLRVDGSDADSVRSQYRTLLMVGLAHPISRWPATGTHVASRNAWIDGHLGAGAGVTFDTGHWQIPVREDVTLAYRARSWITMRAGLGVGVTFDASAGRRTFADLGIPLSITLFRNFEVLYRPMLSVPLGSETSPVFGGQRELATRLAFLPFELLLRVRIPALAW